MKAYSKTPLVRVETLVIAAEETVAFLVTPPVRRFCRHLASTYGLEHPNSLLSKILFSLPWV